MMTSDAKEDDGAQDARRDLNTRTARAKEATPPRTTSEVQEFDCAGSACRGADTPDQQCLSTKATATRRQTGQRRDAE